MQLTFVSEFDLLRQSYGDAEIAQKPWMAPANRIVCNKLFKVVRAEEELERLNIEMRRLRTWLYAEEKTYRDAIQSLMDHGDNLWAAELKARHCQRKLVNDNHHRVLNTIEKLKGFTGDVSMGIPLGWTAEMAAALKADARAPVEASEGEVAEELEREACRDDVARLATQVETLDIQD